MEIGILGAHNCESSTSGCVCLIVDGTLAVDAGSLTSHLTIKEQMKLHAILISHRHYDHLRDIPAIALNLHRRNRHIDVYSPANVVATIEAHMLNGILYPRFQELPQEEPTVNLNIIRPCLPRRVDGHEVMAVPVRHCEEAVGYQIIDDEGKTVFYTSDTGPGLAESWQCVSPQMLIIEVTVPNELQDFALKTGHLTPALLEIELRDFLERKGYLPRVVAIHLDIGLESKIRPELEEVAEHLETTIEVAREGMLLKV